MKDFKVFIAGSMNIKHLAPEVKKRIDNIIARGFEIVVGDADGADTSVQQYLLSQGSQKATVVCSGSKPRNNLGNWPVQHVETKDPAGTRAFFTAKDLHMAKVADIGLMIWDTKSTGTLSNIVQLITRKKKSVVFVNKEKTFKNILTPKHLEELLEYMSDHAKQKADEKIKLFSQLKALKHEQAHLFTAPHF